MGWLSFLQWFTLALALLGGACAIVMCLIVFACVMAITFMPFLSFLCFAFKRRR